MTVMIDAEYVLKIIGEQLYGEMSAGDEYLYDHKTYDDGLEWCFELIRNVANNTQETILVKPPKWISVKDRLPENDDRVIVQLRSNEYSKVNDKMKIAFFYGDRFYIYIAHSDGITNDTITYPCLVNNNSYWMPLPEPPEEENEN